LAKEHLLLHRLCETRLHEESQKVILPSLLTHIDSKTYLECLKTASPTDGYRPLNLVCLYPKNRPMLQQLLAKIPTESMVEILDLRSPEGAICDEFPRNADYRSDIANARAAISLEPY
jgi:hypothetical protein